MRRRPTNATVVELDDIDRAIIEHLQSDGRRPYGRIAEAVGLSEFAVRQRTQRLVEEGVIRIVAITDPEILGQRLRATLGLLVVADIDPVVEALDQLAEADYVVATAGTYDLLVEVQCEGEAHLNELINGTIRKLPGVSRIDTMVYLKFHKRTYAWPPGARLPVGNTDNT
jgi:Lrp/AsnC family transcriptional regulator for asnA, asnC and gidA